VSEDFIKRVAAGYKIDSVVRAKGRLRKGGEEEK